MASRLTDVSQPSEASPNPGPPGEGGLLQKGKQMPPMLGNPSRKYGNSNISRIVDSRGKPLATIPTID